MSKLESDEWLENAIRELPRRTAPPGWENRVLGALPRSVGRRPWRPWVFGGGFAAMAAAAVLFLVLKPRREELALENDVVVAAQVVRASTAKVGDTLRASVSLAGAAAWDVRIYVERRLVAACSSGATCRRDGDRATAEVVLPEMGSYRSLLLVGERIPATSGDLDEDVNRASGMKTILSDPIRVLPFKSP